VDHLGFSSVTSLLAHPSSFQICLTQFALAQSEYEQGGPSPCTEAAIIPTSKVSLSYLRDLEPKAEFESILKAFKGHKRALRRKVKKWPFYATF
jgi:hypothetical protein